MKSIKILLITASCAFANEAEPKRLTQTRDKYNQALSALEADHANKVKNLRNQYLLALKKIQKSETGKENLDGALVVRDEINKISKLIKPQKTEVNKSAPKKEEVAKKIDFDGTVWKENDNTEIVFKSGKITFTDKATNWSMTGKYDYDQKNDILTIKWKNNTAQTCNKVSTRELSKSMPVFHLKAKKYSTWTRVKSEE